MGIKKVAKIVGLNSLCLLVFFLAAELFSHLVLKFRDGGQLSVVEAAYRLQRLFGEGEQSLCMAAGDCPELQELVKPSDQPKYLWSLFNPQRHPINSQFWFGQPPDSKIVFCEEDDGLITFNTNSYGFRKGQTESPLSSVDAIFIGDSFTEGACVPDGATVPDYLSKLEKFNVLNFGVGGTGPLFQYALLSEILGDPGLSSRLAGNAKVFWVVFTGNDLWNLRDEKITSLSAYLAPEKTSNYFSNLDKISNHQREFMDKRQGLYLVHGPPADPAWREGGVGLSFPGSVEAELKNWDLVYKAFAEKVKENNLELILVVLSEHPGFHRPFMVALERNIQGKCDRLEHRCIQFNLSKNANYLTINGGHLSPRGYKVLAKAIARGMVRSAN